MSLITISCLGKKGRAGNSFFQWAFAKGYAKAMGADLQTPDWFGRRIFPEAAADPLIDRVLPKTHCDSVCLQMGLPLGYFFGKTDIDLDLYAQHQVFIDFYSRSKVREWFKLFDYLEYFAPSNISEHPYSALHFRRGDYAMDPTFQKLYCTVSDNSYNQAVELFRIPIPIMSIFEGSAPEVLELTRLGVPWLTDWLRLRDAGHLLRSNSTFSWWAGTLGHGNVYSPLVENKIGLQHVPFVEGNWPNTAGIFKNQSDLFLKE